MKVHNLIDLASITNISIFILDDLLHGFYVHGRAAAGYSDGNAEQLKKILDGDIKGEARRVGLNQQDTTELQTYEIYIAPSVRVDYGHHRSVIMEELQIEEQKDLKKKSSEERQVFDQSERMKMQMAEFLKEYLMVVESTATVATQEKTAFNRFFGVAPQGLGNNIDRSVFLGDPQVNFQEHGGLGIDFQMAFFRTLLFWFWDILLGNTYFSFVFTYFIERLIWWIRNLFVSNNITGKSLVDDRFLA